MNQRNNSTGEQKLHDRKRHIVLYVATGLLLLGALWGSKQAGTTQDLRMRQELAQQAVAVAAAVPINEAQVLAFTINDLERPEYARLCAMLKAWSDLTGLESIYTMKLREDGQLVFGPESLEPDSPGDVYQQPSDKDFLPFQTGEPVVMGPVTDEYGTFVSAAAPVLHPQTGEVLMTVGIDIEAPEWRAEIRRAQWRPLLLVLIPLVILLTGGVLMKQRQRLSPKTGHRLHHVEAIVCAGISLLLTLAATLHVALEDRNRRIDTFYSGARLKAEVYTSSFRSLAEKVHMLANSFESREFITSGEFQTLCGPLIKNHSVEGCAWIPEVPAAQRELFEATVRADGHPDFRIRLLPDADGNAPPDTLYPALYVESANGKEDALGYNLASEPVRRAALLEALHSGYITATGPIRLAALPAAPQGLFIFCPVNAAAQNGVLALAIRPERLMGALSSQTRRDASGMNACLLQLNPGAEPQTLFCPGANRLTDCINAAPRNLQMYFPLFVFGKPYALCITPDSQWLAANPLQRARFVLAAGLILSALLTALIGILVNRPRLLEKQVRERTAELRESEERTEIATAAAGIGIWDRDIVNDRLVWDKRMIELYGVRKEDFGGAYETWQQCVHPDDLERATAETTAAERGDKPFDTEFRIVRPDGQTRHIRAHAKVIRDRNGVPVHMIGTNQDISQRVLAEQKLKQSEEQFRSTINDLLVGVVVHHADTSIAFSNPQAQSILGLSAEQIAGKQAADPAWCFVHPNGSPMTVEEYPASRVATTEEKLQNLTLGIQHPDREEITWVIVSGIPVFDGHKNLQRIIINFIDVTEQKKAEKALIQSEEMKSKMVSNIGDVIVIINADGTNRYKSPNIEKQFGWTPEEVVGNPALDLIHPDDMEKAGQVLGRLMKRPGATETTELRYRRKDGTYSWIGFTGTNLLNDPDIQGILGNYHNITERKNAEEELNHKIDELEQFNKMAVGRELRMIELKKEINALCRELGKKEPYPLQFES